MEPFELLSEIDKERLKKYITYYGSSFSELPNGEMAPLEYILRNWNSSKQTLLNTIFKDKLIVEIPVEYEMGIDELEKRIRSTCFSNWDGNNIACRIHDELSRKMEFRHEEESWLLNYLFSAYEWAKNSFDPYGDAQRTYTFSLANGKNYKVNAGTKVMRIINKLCNSWGVQGFEEAQIAHSIALNQKKIRGTLCLSIHPMDYITMSDNGYDWDSCMRWKSNGEYRQGTVEMMNSPCVIVGYLKGSNDWYWNSYGDFSTSEIKEDNRELWNSKKWRCLFIYDEDNRFCVSIKNYPYTNNFLTQEAVKAIATLAGWEATTYPFKRSWQPQVVGDKEITLALQSGYMYNDFGETNHFIAINPNLTEPIDQTDYFFSGVSQCMWCGSEYIDCEGEENRVLCGTCDPWIRCCCCDEVVGDNDYVHYLNDDDAQPVCDYCYHNNIEECEITGNEQIKDCMMTLYVYDKTKNIIYDRSIRIDENAEYSERWSKFSHETTYASIRYDYRYYYCVDINELTEWGRELFNLNDEADLIPLVENY